MWEFLSLTGRLPLAVLAFGLLACWLACHIGMSQSLFWALKCVQECSRCHLHDSTPLAAVATQCAFSLLHVHVPWKKAAVQKCAEDNGALEEFLTLTLVTCQCLSIQ